MADINLKNLADIPVVEPSKSTHLLAEQDGAYARVPKDAVGGGVTSWNDLPDRPFGEEDWSIEWDGDLTGREVIRVEGIRFVRLAEEVDFSTDDLIGGRMTYTVTDSPSPSLVPDGTYTVDVTNDTLMQMMDGFVGIKGDSNITPMPFIIINTYGDADMGGDGALPKGVFFMVAAYLDVNSLSNTTIKTIDPKYLPSGAGGALVVNFALNSDYTISNGPDKTVEEVLDAVQQGVTVYALLSAVTDEGDERIFQMPLVSCDMYEAWYGLTMDDAEGGMMFMSLHNNHQGDVNFHAYSFSGSKIV